jgi:hypothetical protein
MSTFHSNNSCQSFNSHQTVEKELLATEKYLLIRRNFIEFQDCYSENNRVVQREEHYQDDILCENDFGIDEAEDDEELANELAQLFTSDTMLENEELVDELDRLEEYLAESQTVLVACPQNMPQWETAWWGKKVLSNLKCATRRYANKIQNLK